MSIEALKKAREALVSAKTSMAMFIDQTGGPHWGKKLMAASLACAESERLAIAALAAIDAEAKPVVRMLTDEELAECCGGCKVTSAAMTWMRRSVSKAAEVWGLTIGEQG